MTPEQWKSAGGWTEVSGHRIFFRDTGEKKPVMTLLHGFPTSSWDWAPVWTALNERFRLIAPDLMGFGFSDRPHRYHYTIAEQAKIVVALLQHRGITETHLLAHDYGDTVAQELLARQNESHEDPRLQSVCLLNGGLFPETHRARLIQKLLLSPLGPLLVRLQKERSFARSFSAVFGAETQPSEADLKHFWSLVSYNDGHLALPRLLHYIPERIQFRERWVAALQQAVIPVRIINGLEDPVSGAHMVTRYRELIADANVVELHGIGHYPQTEDPESVIKAVLEFVKED